MVGSLVLTVLIFLNSVLPVSGQPGYGESCSPDNPSPECPSAPVNELYEGEAPPIFFQPSVAAGQLYVQDKTYSQKGQVTDNDMPIYLVLIVPPDAVRGLVAIIQYYPPNYNLRNYIESPWKRFSGGGAKTFGGYFTGAADPKGKYAFKALVWWRDSSGVKYAEPIAFVDYVQITCSEGAINTLEMCPDGSWKHRQVCRNNAWNDEYQQCPEKVVCSEGAINTLEMCPDGSWKHRQVCRNNAWVEEFQQCPTDYTPMIILALAVVVVGVVLAFAITRKKK